MNNELNMMIATIQDMYVQNIISDELKTDLFNQVKKTFDVDGNAKNTANQILRIHFETATIGAR
ncbi:hypothetical protein Pla110_33150 [Polystyrenella longa]|uniref:Uncharacterized protein n=1 Tax=Polystyrenella longa TaxID=2528007 RepID=A0A518CQS3_9PLAN|nr:hypothetical protein [Polystyrenella longa]QDU81573.1 hypothetical protein Pla110_33150 [Polystyrenella longa]